MNDEVVSGIVAEAFARVGRLAQLMLDEPLPLLDRLTLYVDAHVVAHEVRLSDLVALDRRRSPRE